MFYHFNTQQEFASLREFRLAFPNTSFGMLDNEPERNACGLFTIDETIPEGNNIYGYYERGGVEEVAGKYVRQWNSVSHSPEVIRLNLKQAVTNKRWEVETSGLELPGGGRVATGTADQNRISNVITNATNAGLTTVDFKSETGWVTLTLQEIQDIATMIAMHVQTCFSVERQHHMAIDATLDEDLSAYDINTLWPV